jgi:hypothetical protein
MPPATPDETRARAQLLHETINGALQVMHRDYFRDGSQRLNVPSHALEDVFAELTEKWNVKLTWLAVNAPAMNDNHRAQSAFDTRAVDALSAGADTFDESKDNVYRFAGAIELGNQCLKCHVPNRKSLEPRKAALVISMPFAPNASTTAPGR